MPSFKERNGMMLEKTRLPAQLAAWKNEQEEGGYNKSYNNATDHRGRSSRKQLRDDDDDDVDIHSITSAVDELLANKRFDDGGDADICSITAEEEFAVRNSAISSTTAAAANDLPNLLYLSKDDNEENHSSAASSEVSSSAGQEQRQDRDDEPTEPRTGSTPAAALAPLFQGEQQRDDIVASTLPHVPGYQVLISRPVVRTECDMYNTHSVSIGDLLQEAQDQLTLQARQLDCNAVLGIRFDMACRDLSPVVVAWGIPCVIVPTVETTSSTTVEKVQEEETIVVAPVCPESSQNQKEMCGPWNRLSI